ncbi:MAG: hypothetical protein ACOYI8_00045 [Christensenellales bacterium]|jgi:hypothetical protein
MFTYLHCYMPETWEAQMRAGLLNANAGIRFCQSIDIEPHLKFNNLAREGGALHSMLRATRMPLYIDRLQGGCFLEEYPYDMRLVNAYRDMLGERFWGFQMHEWMSNYTSDLRKLTENNCPAWTKEDIEATILRAFPYPHIFLESMNAEELAELGFPDTCEKFLQNAEALFRKRMAYTDNMLIPCDSFALAHPIELRAGVKRLMPEIGAQTPDTRIQLAYARGMAKAKNIPFGAYYEPWGGSPFSACCYHRQGKNEWNLGGSADFPFHTEGENGGSSRSMQRRMHLYAYMAGASFMAEEWGMCNTFYDWEDFDLSPYGAVKRDFIRFTEKYPNIGQPIIPIAVVLPKELPVFEMNAFDKDTYMGYEVPQSIRSKLKITRGTIDRLFRDTGSMLGTEKTSLLNCNIPDAIDIVQEDFIRAEEYAYIVDCTGTGKYRDVECEVEDVGTLLDKILPCKVRGSVMKQFTRTDDGTVYLMLLNNSGVERTVEHGERLLPEAAQSAAIQTRDGKHLRVLEGDGKLVRCGEGEYRVDIPAGGWFFGIVG